MTDHEYAELLQNASDFDTQVFCSAYFGKLASYGIVPESEAEAMEFLAVGDKIASKLDVTLTATPSTPGALFRQKVAAKLGEQVPELERVPMSDACRQTALQIASSEEGYKVAQFLAITNALIEEEMSLAQQEGGQS